MDTNQRYGILVVDDDINILKNIQRFFLNHYETRIAISAEEGLRALTTGFSPAVIIADQVMPKMRGSEFLKHAAKLAPQATRILLVGYNDVKDVVAAVAEGGAYMSLPKPFIESEIVQAIKIGIDNHKQSSTNKQFQEKEIKLVTELKRLNNVVNTLTQEKNAIFEESLKAITSIISVNEKFYFTDHASYVNGISVAMADLMRLRADVVRSVSIASQVHNVVSIKMPDKFKVVSPFDFTSEEMLEKYLKYYNESLYILNSITAFKDITPIVSQINEHYDGTGLPNKISKGQIFIESQIIAIANTYHNRVYLLPEKKYDELLVTGKVVQTPEETLRRHTKAIHYIENRSSWFDEKLIKRFMELYKAGQSPFLKPVEDELVLEYNG